MIEGLDIADARVWRRKEAKARSIEAGALADAMRDEENLVWVDLLDPSPEQLRQLVLRLGVSGTVVEDALAPHERAKVTAHADHLFFTVYATQLATDTLAEHADGGSHLSVTRISGIVLPRALITIRVRSPHCEAFDMGEVVKRWDDSASLMTQGSGALVHGLLDYVVDGHFDTIQSLDDALEGLEETLFAERRTGSEFVRTTYAIRKDLVALRRVVLPMREVVNALMRHRGRTGGPLDAWYDDLYDHVLRASEWTESLRDMVSTVFETNLSLQDARLNTIMKKLAAWAAIISVPTAVTGWFGQNVPYPGFQAHSGLVMSVVLIVALSGGLYAIFRHNDWL